MTYADRSRRCLLAAAMLVGASSAAAADDAVDLELVLAVDVSRSINALEAKVQRDGYVQAFLDPAVIAAIQSGQRGRIAVAYMEWAGNFHQKILVPWTVIDGRATAESFVAKLAAHPIEAERRTSISGAIEFATPLFDNNGYEAERRVIDISGDGPNNQGSYVLDAREIALARGITINGLPVMADPNDPFGFPSLPDLDLYYEDCVIGGPGAFVIVARGFKDFATAVRQKLILEIADLQPPPRRGRDGIVPAAAPSRPPCDVGERQWQRFMGGP